MTRDKNQPDKPGKPRESRSDHVARPLSPDLQAHIGLRLKAFYDSVLSEPIPDRFAELLNRLDADEPSLDGGAPAPAARTSNAGQTKSEPEASLNGDAETDVRQ